MRYRATHGLSLPVEEAPSSLSLREEQAYNASLALTLTTLARLPAVQFTSTIRTALNLVNNILENPGVRRCACKAPKPRRSTPRGRAC